MWKKIFNIEYKSKNVIDDENDEIGDKIATAEIVVFLFERLSSCMYTTSTLSTYNGGNRHRPTTDAAIAAPLDVCIV